MSAFAPFKALVHQRCGLHLDGLAEARLFRAVASLQASTGLTDITQLLKQLSCDTALFDQFVSQLTVNETYFFREPDALDWLVNTYLPQRLTTEQPPLSIFSAGCSSGEEPYSVAMMLFECFGERAKALFTITGGDLDHQVLAKARQAVYGGMAFRALSPAFKKRYFSPHKGRYKLHEPLRQWVTFRPFNLLNANEDSPVGPFDVILFRNVSIYFDQQTRRHIHQQLSQLLAPNGILLCGVTETLGNDLGVFELTEAQGVFYFRHAEQPAIVPETPLQPSLLAMDNMAEDSITEDSLSVAESANKQLALDNCTDVAPQAPRQHATEKEPTDSISHQLHTAHRLLNQNAFDDAATLLEALLEQQPWSIDALVLAGLVARWQQRPQLAYEHFKRAIYAAPECWPAHFYLAELYRQGELADKPLQRKQRYAAVVRLLTTAPTSDGGLDTITPPLPPGDARFLAERYLDAVNLTLASTSTTQGVG
ncbi:MULTISPECIES: CheR family methyltransferase [Halomonadaceae]|jgi:chemotaxis protein methyltransferase CheR|uniref:CheR family methyltransferase n=1 Tax=Halomonadaceae TaxID=28256 RepID=UPI00038CEA90|nr:MULTISPECIES: protein-glutamate O-methyltransferase CheR [Halomonas]CAD5258156.1 Chemotaxis protein methyltransferase [Halomonas sp. 59]CAD5258366.1 Chemotaxis protein methyltransferase [Halomonas sp. 113]CAD5272284.1 Chemotaxis protein methyltransferase [Halomonas sp. I3]CAD5290259.1 Chemotaxis protein methyltransferase [Halomonas sp. 156]CDG53433.1 Chemotaxis protein methyltransferase [Halomonas sp. A3H3]